MDLIIWIWAGNTLNLTWCDLWGFWMSSSRGNPPPPSSPPSLPPPPLLCPPSSGNLTQRSGLKREREREQKRRKIPRKEEERFVDVPGGQCLESWLTSRSDLPITAIINSIQSTDGDGTEWKMRSLLALDKSRSSRRDAASFWIAYAGPEPDEFSRQEQHAAGGGTFPPRRQGKPLPRSALHPPHLHPKFHFISLNISILTATWTYLTVDTVISINSMSLSVAVNVQSRYNFHVVLSSLQPHSQLCRLRSNCFHWTHSDANVSRFLACKY